MTDLDQELPELPVGPPPTEGSGEMTLMEHLGELRLVLLQSIIAVLVAAVVAWFVSDRAVDFITAPARGVTDQLVFLSPTGAFMLRMKTALGLGLFLAAPFVVWRIWSFVVPGLLRRERVALLPVVTFSLVLFYAGAAFAYYVILPVSLRFLLGFATESLRPFLSGEQYFTFAIRIGMAFAIVFQMPLVVSILTWAGLLDPEFLKRTWRYGIIVVFVGSAMLTPPDVASQLLMAGPVMGLYFLSMLLAQAIGRRRKKEQEEQENK